MRALIIITLIVLILTIYFRYEKFQMSNNKLNFNSNIRRLTHYKKTLPPFIMTRLHDRKKQHNYFDNFFLGKGKNIILPGVFLRPIHRNKHFIMGRPQSTD